MSQGLMELPDKIPGVDVEDGLNRLRGNKKLYVKLLLHMKKDLPGLQEKMAESLSTGNFQDMAQHAHTVKGMAGNLSATDLQEASAQLEAAVKLGDIAEIFTKLESFDARCKEIYAALAVLEG